MKNKNAWLNETSEASDLFDQPGYPGQRISWTAHHASKSRDMSENIYTINVPLSLIDYKSSAIELQYHIMNIAVEYTKYLNSSKIDVGCSNQPFALKKTIQLTYPGLATTFVSLVNSIFSKQR